MYLCFGNRLIITCYDLHNPLSVNPCIWWRRIRRDAELVLFTARHLDYKMQIKISGRWVIPGRYFTDFTPLISHLLRDKIHSIARIRFDLHAFAFASACGKIKTILISDNLFYSRSHQQKICRISFLNAQNYLAA